MHKRMTIYIWWFINEFDFNLQHIDLISKIMKSNI